MDQKAWIVAVDMGYGHQRAACPLRRLSPTGKIISANNYQGIPKKDYRIWRESEVFYGFVSRLINVPLIGGYLFNLYEIPKEITRILLFLMLKEPIKKKVKAHNPKKLSRVK